MAVKKCCIEDCSSCSSRSEDAGVTYHKFPKDVSIKDIWLSVTRKNHNNDDTTAYVCSRHFCKSDFKIYKDSKYVLKSDAIPSIFPWIKDESLAVKIKMEPPEQISETLNNSKESEGETVDAITKFIEQNEDVAEPSSSNKTEDTSSIQKDKVPDEGKDFDERMAVASSMMDMIINETETRVSKKKGGKPATKPSGSQDEKGTTTMALSIGSKVEAKDYAEQWHPAEIVEVDYDEMEVLVHYKDVTKKHDEWINVSSPRLRPQTFSPKALQLKSTTTAASTTSTTITAASTSNSIGTDNTINIKSNDVSTSSLVPVIAAKDIKEEPKAVLEEKQKLMFSVGERCLARWRDNRRFMATISSDLGNGSYEIMFDDGFKWTCPTARLNKTKDSGKVDGVESGVSPAQYGAGPSTAVPTAPAFHTHLFDPTRDYLGSKSERREMKRKLNIKEIFNIGQKRHKKNADKPIKVEKKPNILRKKPQVSVSPKTEIPDAVASIIGTVKNEIVSEKQEEKIVSEKKEENNKEDTKVIEPVVKEDVDEKKDIQYVEDESMEVSLIEVDNAEKEDSNSSDPVQKEEVKLQQFEKPDDTKQEVINRIKEVINKLEDGINKVENTPKVFEFKSEEVIEEKAEEKSEVVVTNEETSSAVAPVTVKSKISKLKKSKKLRLLQQKRSVKREVERARSELEVMKRQIAEMRQQMMATTAPKITELLPGEWACRWVNGQPVGRVCQLDDGRDVKVGGLPRRSVQVEDERLPPGWTKHMVRRSLGHSAGKWDVVLVNGENRRFHTKTDMRNYLENNLDEALRQYEPVLMDFGVHLKLARRLGWYTTTPDGVVDDTPVIHLPAGTLPSTSPLVKAKKLSMKKVRTEKEKDKFKIKKKQGLSIRMPKYLIATGKKQKSKRFSEPDPAGLPPADSTFDSPLEDGYVYVGSLKVQIIENLLRCPAEGCFKNFRNNTLIKMHIKHYHKELRKMLGKTPKVLDLAHERAIPHILKQGKKDSTFKKIKVKITKPAKEPKPEIKEVEKIDDTIIPSTMPVKLEDSELIGISPKVPDSPKLRQALANKPVKRPRVLLPVRRPEPEIPEVGIVPKIPCDSTVDDPEIPALDFETAISTHTVTKPADFDVKRKLQPLKTVSEEEDWFNMTSDMETRSSFPRSVSPDSKPAQLKAQTESAEEQKNSKTYMFTDTGERIKIVHMKREEIINCHCGFREEDGLMVQCELCLCWQHALCHNIQKESEVPEKYTCSICLNPRRGRRSQRFLHDQDRLYEGLLPGAKPKEALRRSHELSGNLLRIMDALHATRVKYRAATKKNHPKLYLWAQDWENGELALTQELLNSDYSDLNVIMTSLDKENLPIRPEDLKDPQMDINTPPSEEHDRYNQREGSFGTPSLLSGLLASPGGASLELPISTSELERFAQTVQEEVQRVSAPQPEAPIENGACRKRLLKHIQRCQAVIDARLDSIEAQVAELESEDPSFEDDETADYLPRTKQTIQMLLRDLDNMEELGVIT